MKYLQLRAAIVAAALATACVAHADAKSITIDLALAGARTHGYDRLLADAAAVRAEGEGSAAAKLPNPTLDVAAGPLLNYRPCAVCWPAELAVALSDSGAIVELLSGRHGAKSDAARASIDVAAADRTTIRRELDALVRAACVRLAVAEVVLRAEEDRRSSLAKALDVQRLRSPAVLDEGAFARFELEKSAGDRAVLEATARLRAAQGALAVLVGERGIAPEYVIDVAILDAPLPSDLDALDETGAARAASGARSEIAAADANARGADARVAVAQRSRVPTIVFGAWLQAQGVGYPANTPLSVGGSIDLELPLFDTKLGQVRGAEADAIAWRVSAQRARATVTWDVASAVVRLAAARAIEASAISAEKSAEAAEAVVTRQFDAGAVPIVDRLDAERALGAARTARAEASGEVRIAAIEVDRALGRDR